MSKVRVILAIPLVICAIGFCAVSGQMPESAPPGGASARPLNRSAALTLLALKGVELGEEQIDLSALRELVGDARVVCLGEPALGCREPLLFRNHLWMNLVEEMGFTAIAVESAFPESRPLADYIAGGPGTTVSQLTEARTWWHEPLKENLQLVNWMRDWNQVPGQKHSVRFYGIDLSYTGPWGSRPTPLCLEAALNYLERVDSNSAATFKANLQPWLARLADPMSSWTKSDHDACTAAIDDLVAHFQQERVHYLAAGSAADYEWASRAAIVAQQADRMFRVAPAEPPGDRVPPSAWKMVNARDAAMADNVLWALRQEGAAGRVLVVTHIAHAQDESTSGGPWDAYTRRPTAMGQYLRAQLGRDLVIIGMKEAANTSPMLGVDGVVEIDSLTPAYPVNPPK